MTEPASYLFMDSGFMGHAVFEERRWVGVAVIPGLTRNPAAPPGKKPGLDEFETATPILAAHIVITDIPDETGWNLNSLNTGVASEVPCLDATLKECRFRSPG